MASMFFMSPEHAALIFARFTAQVRDLEDPEDQELARLVLYPDGSGGIAWDPPVNSTKWRVPPTELDVQWHGADDAISQLGAGSPVATAPAQAGPSGGSDTGYAAIASLTLQWLAVRDERDRLKAERKALVCQRRRRRGGTAVHDQPEPCWKLQLATLCATCVRNQELQKALETIHGRSAAYVRQIRRHAEEAKMLAPKGARPVAVAITPKAPKRRGPGRPRKGSS